MENKDYNNDFRSFDNNDETLEISSNNDDVFDLNSFATDEDITEISSSSKTKPAPEPKQPLSFKTIFKRAKKALKETSTIKIVLSLFLVFVITGCLVVGTFLVYVFAFVDGTVDNNLNQLKLNYTTTIYTQNSSSGKWEEYQRLHGEDNRIWIHYDRTKAAEKAEGYNGIPHNLAMAFVAIEDKRFFEHDGVDWRRTFGAFVGMITNNSTFGGSTITQQLVKNITKDDDRKASRKVREIMRARYLEGEYAKEVILECYMNTIAMGNGIYGVEVAAEFYFGKQVTELTLAECASLAGITKSPESYRPDKNLEKNTKRRNDILYEMYDQGYITKEEYEAAKAEELNVVADRGVLKETKINSYFVDALIDEVIQALMKTYNYDESKAAANFYTGGYQIYSTIDPNVQSALESVFTDPAYALAGKNDAKLQGSMTVMDYKGHIKGMVGGIGEKTENRGLNRATSSPRQPGSTMKPIAAYAPAVEKDIITYSSIIEDKKRTYTNKDWAPKNWYDHYKGNITAKYALQISSNGIPVHIVDMLSPKSCFEFITQSLGLSNLNSEDMNYAPLGMGGTNGGITTKESAAAFAIFGNGGKYYRPVTFVEIYDQLGNLIVSNKPSPSVAISEDTATIMNHMLRNVVYGSDGTGRAAAAYLPNQTIYAKTGTSDATNDLWFVGGTPYYVASCWCGFDSPQGISSSSVALRMWGNAMSKIHSKLEAATFTDSEYVQCKLFCSETGELATPGCPISEYGWYKLSGQKVCNQHGGKVAIPGTTEEEAAKYLNADSSTDEGASDEVASDETASSDEDISSTQ